VPLEPLLDAGPELRDGLPPALVKALSEHHTLFGAAFG
jgi:hypothetical protein